MPSLLHWFWSPEADLAQVCGVLSVASTLEFSMGLEPKFFHSELLLCLCCLFCIWFHTWSLRIKVNLSRTELGIWMPSSTPTHLQSMGTQRILTSSSLCSSLPISPSLSFRVTFLSSPPSHPFFPQTQHEAKTPAIVSTQRNLKSTNSASSSPSSSSEFSSCLIPTSKSTCLKSKLHSSSLNPLLYYLCGLNDIKIL